MTASFGVATLDPGTEDPDALLRQADRALYMSKSQGRNRVTHHHEAESVSRAFPAGSSGEHATGPGGTEESASAACFGAVPSRQAGGGGSAVASEGGPRSRGWQPVEAACQQPLNRSFGMIRDSRKVPASYRAALVAIQEAVQADIVFACADPDGEVVETVGDNPQPHLWLRQVVQQLAAELPGGGIWKSHAGTPQSSAGEVVLASALALQTEDPKSSRVVALRLGESSPFVVSDLRLAQMLWCLHIEKKRHAKVHDNLKETLFGTIRCLSTAIDAKDPYTCGHSERVARIAVRLGKEMCLSGGEISDLYLAGLLHDVGKIGIRDQVLLKPASLTPEEFRHIQEHVVIGERIIASVPRLAYLRPGVRSHHERIDGTGYPDGLAGGAIPLMARILTVADACDAMMSHRRYRPGLSQPRIEDIFAAGAGSQWDSDIVQSLFACRYDVYEVCQRGLGQSVYMAIERAARGDQENSGPGESAEYSLLDVLPPPG